MHWSEWGGICNVQTKSEMSNLEDYTLHILKVKRLFVIRIQKVIHYSSHPKWGGRYCFHRCLSADREVPLVPGSFPGLWSHVLSGGIRQSLALSWGYYHFFLCNICRKETSRVILLSGTSSRSVNPQNWKKIRTNPVPWTMRPHM